ncbi:MAG: heavy metal translocating P-type ATPase, partial [Clostridia bacterium]|nr:heavy metal translocating P-type ATPase [Clostridia bacterium]
MAQQRPWIKSKGLGCANCARELEEELNNIDGVTSATVDFMGEKVIVDCAGNAIDPVLYCCNHFEDAKITGELSADKESADKSAGSKKIKIANLCCANCARELEEELNKLDGVSATVDFMNMTVILKANSKAAYDGAVHCITHFEDVKIVSDAAPKKSVFKENLADIIAVIISAVCIVPAIVMDFMEIGGIAQYFVYALYGIAFAAAGYTVLWNTVRNIVKGKIFDENFLMTIAAVGAIVLGITTGDGLFEGVAVMLLYRVGELLQSVAVGSSRRSITRLMDLKSETATLLKGEEQVIVSPEGLNVGDKILIKAGGKIPVDGRITEGETLLDMRSLNGEALPKE